MSGHCPRGAVPSPPPAGSTDAQILAPRVPVCLTG
jgi:hypothetical protein